MSNERFELNDDETLFERRLDAWGRAQVHAASPAPARAFIEEVDARGRMRIVWRVGWASLAAAVLVAGGVVLSRLASTPSRVTEVMPAPPIAAAPAPTLIQLNALNRSVEPGALALVETTPAARARPTGAAPMVDYPRAGDRADHAVARGF